MGSQITFGGFNKVDFTMILNAVMAQEKAPLTALENQQKALTSRNSRYSTLATKLSALENAAKDLADETAVVSHTVTTSDSSALTARAGESARAGTYEVVVQELARAQVIASAYTAPDPDQTAVATGGALTITRGTTTVTIDVSVPLTLTQLADRINTAEGTPVTATVVRADAGAWRLVLTANTLGTDGKFVVANALAGPLTFTDSSVPPDGISGDLDADNAVVATDAVALVNNVAVRSSDSNTITGAIPGVTLTLAGKGTTTTLTVSDDLAGTRTRVKKFVDAYNDLLKFFDEQRTAAVAGDESSLSRDSLLRGLRTSMREVVSASYGTGAVTSLAGAGIAFDRTGRLTFDQTLFDEKMAASPDAVRSLFGGSGLATKGAFDAVQDLVASYTGSSGLLRGVRDRADQQIAALNKRIDDLTDRLDRRRAALQQEYIAADMLMTRLNADAASLSSLGSSYSAF